MPIGFARQGLNLANVVGTEPSIYGTFRGFVRPASTTTVSAYNTAGTALGTAFTHGCGTLVIIRTMKLPGSNNQIIAMGGNSGRRVLHFNAATNVYTSIYNSTAITNIQSCDITYISANDKFYVAWATSNASSTNRVRLTTGTLSAPTTNMTETGLADPGESVYSCVWTPDGGTLAVRGTGRVRTYYRNSSDVMTLNATSYTLAGGLSGTAYEDLTWNATGTVLATGQDSRNIQRYNLGADGALSGGTTTLIPSSGGASRAIPAFNPNPTYANAMAVGMDVINNSSGGFTFAYFASGGSGSLNALPGATGYMIGTTDQPRQLRWSPSGDRLMVLYISATASGFRYSPFTYSEGSTATVATGNSFVGLPSISAYGFDWIYY